MTTNGVPVRPGLLGVGTNLLLGWTAARHHGHGLLLQEDGAVVDPYSSGGNDAHVTEHLNDRALSPAFRAVGALPATGANLVIP